ncbi:MAG: RluA family pseudouridine synthase [Saprospiraceae bacterium]|nr:RluA family pseudouridine synthase [Saprospiraceae bacterium]
MSTISDHILINNHHYIAFNKPGGMAVQSVQNKEQSLEVLLHHYCKTHLFLIHRIDQPCSGLVLFAKKKSTAQYFSEALQDQSIQRTYLAVTSEKPLEPEGTLFHYLFAHKKSNKSYVVDENHKEGKASSLDFKYLSTTESGNHLIEINLKTGRHHQIRAQLGAIHCPILGDLKYGSKQKRDDQSIALHAWKIKFRHPVDNKIMEITAPLPENEHWAAIKQIIATK